MPDGFNPYHTWLGIPLNQQPADFYQLLGVTQFEHDADVISNAADQRMAHVRTFQSGKHGHLSQKILNELAGARLNLLDPQKKATYDAKLRGAAAQKARGSSPQIAVPMSAPTPSEPKPSAGPPRLPVTPQTRESSSGSAGIVLLAAGGIFAVFMMLAVVAVAGYYFMASPQPVAHKSSSPPSSLSSQISTSPRGKQPSTPNHVSSTQVKNEGPKEFVIDGKKFDRTTTASPLTQSVSNARTRQPIPITTGQGLTTDGAVSFVAKVDFNPPTEYVLDFTAKRIDNGESLTIGVPIQGGKIRRTAIMVFDGFANVGHRTGINVLNGHYLDSTRYTGAEVHRGRVFENDKEHHVRIAALDGKLVAYVDGKQVFAWEGAAMALRPNPRIFMPDPRHDKLYVATWFSKYQIKDMSVYGISPQATQVATNVPNSANQTDSELAATDAPPTDVVAVVDKEPEPMLPESNSPESDPGDSGPGDSGPGDSGPADALPPEPTKLAIPDDAQQKLAIKEIQQVFKSEFTAANLPAEKAVLAQQLFTVGKDTKNEANRYALFDLAKNLAAEGSNVQLSLQAADQLYEEYDVAYLVTNQEAMQLAAKSATTQSQRMEVADAAVRVSEQAAAAELYEIARDLADVAVNVAAKVRSLETRNTTREWRDKLNQDIALWEEAEAAAAAIAADETNGDAHFALGKYLCFVRGDFASGVDHLAKGSDADFAAVAKLDAARPTSPDEQLAVANAWWDLAVNHSEDEIPCKRRAVAWYKDCRAGVTPLLRVHVDRRLAQAEDDIPGGTRDITLPYAVVAGAAVDSSTPRSTPTGNRTVPNLGGTFPMTYWKHAGGYFVKEGANWSEYQGGRRSWIYREIENNATRVVMVCTRRGLSLQMDEDSVKVNPPGMLDFSRRSAMYSRDKTAPTTPPGS